MKITILLTLTFLLCLSTFAEDKNKVIKATPVKKEGVSNLYKVSDSLYRSALPTKEGMKNLKDMGVETVINLRSFHSDRDEIADTGLAYEHLYTKTWHVEEKEIVRFLQIVANPKRTPTLVHCMQGVDRTGTMCAVYRIVIQDWKKEDAIKEMKAIGHNTVWKNLPKMLMELDVDSIKKKAGIK
ncbi:MAG: tyrosine-protein phosphatase [Lentisphaeraceae bacterium]|nr:tyrosine-protein phosphatase [Lentisphaeraceae bacterium]